jgi:hypothetical protein
MKNKWLSFVSRVALICNLCSLFIIVIHYTGDFIAGYHAVESTIVVLGFLSVVLNIILQLILFIRRITKKEIPVQAWLRIFNVAVFTVQILYYFIIPGR